MNILIIGGAGFVGSNLAYHFNNKGNHVTVMDNLVRRGVENNLPIFRQKGIEFVHGDIRNKEDFDNLSGKFDVILECAAQPSAINYANPIFDITNNFNGVLNVVEYARKIGAGVIFWSTNKCYTGEVVNQVPFVKAGDRYIWDDEKYQLEGWTLDRGFSEKLSVDGKDHSIYGVSKIAADLLIQEWADAFDVPSVINRFSCLAGPNQWGKAEQGWVTWFAIANELGLPLTIFGWGGNQVRDYLFAEDICRLIEKEIEQLQQHRGEVFNVGGGVLHSVSVNEAIKFLEKNYKPWSDIITVNEERRADQAIYITDITKVTETFDWKPEVSLKEGYAKVFEWIQENKAILEKLYK